MEELGGQVVIEKVTRMNALYDVYESLLTAKQKSYFEMYYLDDLSLAEIASEYEVSRNAVFDNIKRTEKLLEDYEQKLGFVTKQGEREKLYEKLRECELNSTTLALIEQLQAID